MIPTIMQYITFFITDTVHARENPNPDLQSAWKTLQNPQKLISDLDFVIIYNKFFTALHKTDVEVKSVLLWNEFSVWCGAGHLLNPLITL